MKKSKLLWQLFSVFFKIGLFTFGGGYAMISIIEDACVERRGWITKEEMDELVVVAESTPGPIAINCATFVGARQGGFPGAAVATLGIVLPSFLVIFAISRFLDRFLEIRAVASAFQGVKLAVGVLVLDAGLRMLRRMPKKPLPVIILAVTLALMLLVNFTALRLSSVVLLLAAAALSLAVFAAKKRGGEKP
jgi:chromate transporter